jgi:hypothetical protein
MRAKLFRNGRSHALDPWFAEERCSVSALVIDLLIATHAGRGSNCGLGGSGVLGPA